MVRWTKRIRFSVRTTVATLAMLVVGTCHAQTDTSRVTLLEFSSPSCGPCHAMRPTMRRLRAAGYNVQEIDVTREPALARRYHVSEWPTFITVVDGREIGRDRGILSQVQLQEMIAKSAKLSAQAPTRRGVVAQQDLETPPVANQLASHRADNSPPAPSQPWPGEAAGAQPPALDETYSQAALNVQRTPATSGPASTRQGAPAVGSDQLIAATVRLTVEDPTGQSTGTGTVVDSRDGAALVLTCGHIFRDSKGEGSIQVQLFQAGPNGAEVCETVVGELEDYDLERDLALVCVRPRAGVQVAPIAPPGVAVSVHTSVTTVGCNKGANPTAIATQITAIDRYQGFPNVEAAGAPIEGRSGGGMFNSQGQLVGVCFAADHEGNEGLYAALPSIYAKLDSLKLSMIYTSPGLGGRAEQSLAVATPSSEEPTFRGQDAPSPAWPTVEPSSQPAPRALASAPTSDPIGLSAEEQAALQEIKRRAADSEIVCIIRPQTPDGKSEVITLRNASSKFVEALTEGVRD